MELTDEWGHDPRVQQIRHVFRMMEKKQQELLRQIHLSPFDARLRDIRDTARHWFGQASSLADLKGLSLDEDTSVDLYMHCFERALAQAGISVPAEFLSSNQALADLTMEVAH
jgi:hypothetical protein